MSPITGGELTILDLNNQLFQRFERQAGEVDRERLEEIGRNRERLKAVNIQLGNEKKGITWKLKNPDLTEAQRRKLEKQYQALQNKKINYSYLDNEANQILGKDYEYVIEDSWGIDYTIFASDLMKRENPSLFILRKYKRRVEKALAEETDPKRKNIYNKLLANIVKNETLLEESIGSYEYEDRVAAKEADEPYPILIAFIPSNIIEIG